MDFHALAAKRKLAGISSTLILCLVLLLLADGMIAGGRKDPNAHDLTPGQTLLLSDVMPRGTTALAELDLREPQDRFPVRMLETYSGFWLGGVLWRAEVTLPASLPPGEYPLIMRYAQNGTEAAPRQAFRINIHADARAVQAASLSLCMRVLGLSPYLLAVCLLPLAALPMLLSFRLSRRIAQALAAGGMAEIYRAMASEEGQRIFFTPPAGRALAPGDAVSVLDEHGRNTLGAAVVKTLTRGDAEAVMQDGAQVRPGSLARL